MQTETSPLVAAVKPESQFRAKRIAGWFVGLFFLMTIGFVVVRNVRFASAVQAEQSMARYQADALNGYPQADLTAGQSFRQNANVPGFTDPNIQAATVEISKLLQQFRFATGEPKSELRKSLSEAVGKLFDLRHAEQAQKVVQLERQVTEARGLHKKRGERKDEIVERRIAELLESADDLAWNREVSPSYSAQPQFLTKGYSPQSPNSLNESVPNYYSAPQPDHPAYQAYAAPNQFLSSSNNNNAFPMSPSISNGKLPPDQATQVLPAFTTPNATGNSVRNSGFSANASTLPAYAAPNQFLSSSNNNNAFPNSPSISNGKLPPDQATQILPAFTTPNATGNSVQNSGISANASTLPEPSTGEAKARTANNPSSQFLIEAAYAYEEALANAIEAQKHFDRRVLSSRELATAQRNAAKANDIWKNLLRDLEHRLNLANEVADATERAAAENSSREHAKEFALEVKAANAERLSIAESVKWAADFEAKKLQELEKEVGESAKPEVAADQTPKQIDQGPAESAPPEN